MKKILLSIISLISLFLSLSCSQEIQFRDSVIQASVDGKLWLTDEVRAYEKTEKFGNTNFTYTFIEGVKDNQTLTLRILNRESPTHELGPNDSKSAHFVNISEMGVIEFKTGTAYPGSTGKITGFKFDKENQTFSGDFYFTAINTNPKDTINKTIKFEKGHFEKVQLY